MPRPQTEETRILNSSDSDPKAAEQILPLVYEELRKLAAARLLRESPEQTLTATALVHEAYVRVVDGHPNLIWDNRGHFFAAAAQAMRRVLLNRARDKKRIKRGGNNKKIDISSVRLALETPPDLLLDLDEALIALSKQDPQSAELIKLKFYAGLSLKEAATTMGLSRGQGDRLWAYGRAWLYDRLNRS